MEGGRGGGGGGRGRVGGGFWERKCKVCLQTAEFAPSSVNAASCRLGVLHEKRCCLPPPPLLGLARDLGSEGGKKGGFTSESSNAPPGSADSS